MPLPPGWLSLFLLSQSLLEITTGPQNSQVIQHDRGFATIPISGHAANSGKIRATVTANGKPVTNATGTVASGAWTVTLNAVPVGGPYLVSLALLNDAGKPSQETRTDQVYVGDVWILAGQSNMVGRARLQGKESPAEGVQMQLPNGTWAIAEEPLHEQKATPDGEPIGAGPGLTFAKEMRKRTGTPIGLIPVAKGGTNLTQWDPALKTRGAESLYGALLHRVALTRGRVAGILWYQGEADCRTTRAPLYAERFQNLVASLRADLHQPTLPFYYAQLARFAGEESSVPGHTIASEEIVRETQRLAEAKIPNSALVATIDLEMEDHIHLDTPSQQRLGRRFAALVCAHRFPNNPACPAAKTGPRPASFTWESPYRLRIRFDGVNGGLQSTGRVLGFSIAGANGRDRGLVYHARIAGNDIVLDFNRLYTFPQKLTLWYGRGFDPSCNLTDHADLAVPTFGPIELPERPRGDGDKIETL